MRQYFDKFWNHILNENSQKQTIQKIFEKKKKCIHGFFGSWLYAFQWEKPLENHKCIGAGARNVGNLVCFLSNFDPYFPNIRRVRKSCKIYIESIGTYCKNIESIESMEVTTLESNALPFHFAWRVLWDLIIQFRSMIQLNDKSIRSWWVKGERQNYQSCWK